MTPWRPTRALAPSLLAAALAGAAAAEDPEPAVLARDARPRGPVAAPASALGAALPYEAVGGVRRALRWTRDAEEGGGREATDFEEVEVRLAGVADALRVRLARFPTAAEALEFAERASSLEGPDRRLVEVRGSSVLAIDGPRMDDPREVAAARAATWSWTPGADARPELLQLTEGDATAALVRGQESRLRREAERLLAAAREVEAHAARLEAVGFGFGWVADLVLWSAGLELERTPHGFRARAGGLRAEVAEDGGRSWLLLGEEDDPVDALADALDAISGEPRPGSTAAPEAEAAPRRGLGDRLGGALGP